MNSRTFSILIIDCFHSNFFLDVFDRLFSLEIYAAFFLPDLVSSL